ncbi:MAG: prepilin-type N-terminal cleavage/methylation domain-containing protein [Phycisphaerae bacterium]|nr:prepilin-type N-terminal cleavage/methylation domain-containing protein [Phycisphaerae bacterium]
METTIIKKSLTASRGFTLIELITAMTIMLIVVLAIGMVLVDGQRNWSIQYDRIYSDVVTDGYVARRKFDTVMRTASREKVSLDDTGSWIEVYYYASDDSVTLYITDDIGLDRLGQLQISSTNPDASLTLYLGGDFITNNGGYINNLTNDPKKLKIYCLDSCSKVEFKTNCDLYGAIYGPNTDIIMRNSVSIHGAVLGKTFVQSATATFYYDASLREGDVNDEGVHFVVKRWHE